MSDATALGDSGSVLDFMSMKNYPDMSLDISMLNSLGKNSFHSVFVKVTHIGLNYEIMTAPFKQNVHNNQTFHLTH